MGGTEVLWGKLRETPAREALRRCVAKRLRTSRPVVRPLFPMNILSPDTSRAPRLQGLQALRFLVAFLVMGAHAKLVLREHELPQSWDASILSCGVDVFFVISGFVIAMSAGRASGAAGFLLDRALRVLPLYFLLSSIFVAKCFFEGEAISAAIWVNSVLFLPLLDVQTYTNPLHPYGWSIAYEMWFYFLVAALMPVVAKARAGLACAGLLAAGGVVVAIGYDAPWMLPRFLFGPLGLEFAAGFLLFTYRDVVRRRAALAWPLLPVFGAGVWFTSYLGYPGEVIGHTFTGFARAFIWGGLATCVVALFVAAEEKVRWPAWLVALGTASYSIYLIQPITVRLAAELKCGPIARVAAFMALSVALGWLMYVFLEKPIANAAKILRRGRANEVTGVAKAAAWQGSAA